MVLKKLPTGTFNYRKAICRLKSLNAGNVCSLSPTFYNDDKVAYLKNDYRSVITQIDILFTNYLSCGGDFVSLIRMMADVERVLNEDELFSDNVDTQKRALRSIKNENVQRLQ